MHQINKAIPFYSRWQFWLISLLIVATFTRFWKLGEIREYVFDEVYHAFTAKMYALNRYEAWVWWESPPEGVAYEWTHPPLAKVIMSWGVLMFGGPGELPNKIVEPLTVQTPEQVEAEKNSVRVLTPDPFGWRFFSALFGVLGTIALFLFVSSIFKNRWIGLFSGFLFTFDLLPLVQSRTAMNDIFAVTFILFAFYFFTKRSHLMDYRLPIYAWVLSGLFVGAAIASKWTSLFTLGLFGFYHLSTIIYCLLKKEHALKNTNVWPIIGLFLKQIGAGLLCMAVIPYIVYMLSYWQLFTTPIYDYKGNSLSEALKNEVWTNEQSTLEKQLSSSTELNEQARLEKSLAETKRKIAFWSWLDSTNSHFADRYYIWWGVQKQMWWYHTNLKATHNYTSQWWTWPLDIRPVWFYVKYCTDPTSRTDATCNRVYDETGGQKTIGDIYTMGNPAIFWLILPTIFLLGYYMAGPYRVWFYAILPTAAIFLLDYALRVRGAVAQSESSTGTQLSIIERSNAILQAILPQLLLFAMLLMLFLVIVRLIDYFMIKRHNETDSDVSLWHHFVNLKDLIPLLICLLAFSAYWLPWARSPRIMFFYHFFPPVTFFYPLLAYCIYRIFSHSKAGKYVALSYCLIVVIVFAYFYPHVTGWQVSETQREQYFWLKSWK